MSRGAQQLEILYSSSRGGTVGVSPGRAPGGYAPRDDRLLRAPAPLKIPPVVRRNTQYLAAAQAFVGIGNQMVPALGAIMMVALLGSPALAGLATSVLGVSRLLISYPIGWLTDAWGRRAGMLAGLLLSLLGAIVVGLSLEWGSFPLLLVGLVVFGLGIGAGHQLRLAAADMYPPSRRAEGLGYVLTGSLIGALGGPILVSVAQTAAPSLRIDPMALAWLLVPSAILPGMALVFLVRPDPRDIATNLQHYYPGYQPAVLRERVLSSDPTGWRAFLRRPGLRGAFAASFAVQGNMSMMMAMTSLALANHMHTLSAISLSVSLHGVGMFGFSLPLGWLSDRLGRRTVLLAGFAFALVGSFLVSLTSEYWTITAGTFFVGLGWSCVNVAGSALIADLSRPLERGRAIGTNDAISSVASVTMPLLAGPLVAVWGLPSLTLASILLVAMPLPFMPGIPGRDRAIRGQVG